MESLWRESRRERKRRNGGVGEGRGGGRERWKKERERGEGEGRVEEVLKESPTTLPLTDLPVQSTRPQQCWIKDVRTVGGHYHLHLTKTIKPIHLVQQFHQGSLDLPVG